MNPHPTPPGPASPASAVNVAIAKACGYRTEKVEAAKLNNDQFPWRLIGPSGNQQGAWWMTEEGAWSHGLPDYYASLDAIHEAEKTLNGGMRSKYDAELSIIAERDHCFIWETTATQKCEAFLKTLDKWPPATA